MGIDFVLVGKRIREVREGLQISQLKLAEMAGLSVSYISMVENGKRQAGLDSLVRMANGMGVTVDELLNGNQLYNPTEYQTDLDLLLSDCSSREKRMIFELARAMKEILREEKEIRGRDSDVLRTGVKGMEKL